MIRVRSRYFLLGGLVGIDMALVIITPLTPWSLLLGGWAIGTILFVAYAEKRFGP